MPSSRSSSAALLLGLALCACGAGVDDPLATRGAPARGELIAAALAFSPHAERPLRERVGRWLRVNFADLAAGADGLDGEAIELAGSMIVLRASGGQVSAFLLCRHPPGCCLGRMPTPREWVVVHADPPVAPVPEGLTRVRGRLRHEPADEAGGVIEAAYQLEAAEVVAQR